MSIDNYYWVFSAAAQSIAALIAFLMAGVALAFSMMDRLADQDETLYEIIEALKRKQHREMAALAVVTGVAVVASLIAVYINPWKTMTRDSVMIFAAVIDMAAITTGIYYVISIVMPSRYSRAAQREYAEATEVITSIPGQESSSVFFKEFIDLELDIRAFLQEHDLYVPSRGVPKMSFSFRQMVDALYQNEIISKEAREKLLIVNKFRNLLFHGHIDQVDEGVIQTLREVNKLWQGSKSMSNNQRQTDPLR